MEPEVISVGNALYLYYRTDHSIAVATNSSDDGTNWTDMTTVLTPSPSGWDSGEVIAPSVVIVNSTYYLFYEANDSSTGRRAIGVAISSSPTGSFTKCSYFMKQKPWRMPVPTIPVFRTFSNNVCLSALKLETREGNKRA